MTTYKQLWEEHAVEKYGSIEAAKAEMARRATGGPGPRKLSDKDVRDIRNSKQSDKQLAAKYKVHYQYINRIKNRRVRTDVE